VAVESAGPSDKTPAIAEDSTAVGFSASEKPDPGEGRELYGQDPEVYDRGRPEYPPEVYRILREDCGLAAGIRVLEIGPGTGQATRHLLQAGARVTAVEPNQAMAAHLQASMAGDSHFELLATSFEKAVLPEEAFDLVVAAMSFHWVEPREYRRLSGLLRPGGLAATWWTVWRDPAAPDDFDSALDILLGDPANPPAARFGALELDVDARTADLRLAGLDDVRAHIIRSTVTLDARQMRDLWATTAVVLRRDTHERQMVLDAIERLVERSFGGTVTKTLVTGVYTDASRRRTGPPD
jgi:SAM-dependent methyltransferase